jgi:hypothetical protein
LIADSGDKNRTNDKKGKNSQAALPILEQQLNAAANALAPARTLPVALTVSYFDMPDEGMLVNIASQIRSGALEFTSEKGDKAQASIDLLGLIYDSDGKRAGFFRELLTVDASHSVLSKSEQKDIYHSYQTKLKPGLYQVRVAARDAKSGSVGSAVQWMEIPDLSTRRLALSSLTLTERVNDAQTKQGDGATDAGAANLRIMVDRRIARTSQLRYLMFIYNASRGKTGTAQPDVTVQTQILRGNNAVVTSPARQISTEGQDPARLPYAAEISLDTLPAGRYELLISVQDRIAKSNSTQRVSFEIK